MSSVIHGSTPRHNENGRVLLSCRSSIVHPALRCNNEEQAKILAIVLQEDGDDCEYEDLQPLPLPPPRGQRAPGQPGSGRGSYSWEVLQVRQLRR